MYMCMYKKIDTFLYILYTLYVCMYMYVYICGYIKANTFYTCYIMYVCMYMYIHIIYMYKKGRHIFIEKGSGGKKI